MIEFNESQIAVINGATEGYLAGKFTKVFENLMRYDKQQIKEKMDDRFAYSHSGLKIIQQFFDKNSAELTSETADIFRFAEIPADLKDFIQAHFLAPLLHIHKIFSDKSTLQMDGLFQKTFRNISDLQVSPLTEADKETLSDRLQSKLRDCKFETLTSIQSFLIEKEAGILSSTLRNEREASAARIEALEKEIETLRSHHELGGGVTVEMPHEEPSTIVASAAAAPIAPKQRRRKSI